VADSRRSGRLDAEYSESMCRLRHMVTDARVDAVLTTRQVIADSAAAIVNTELGMECADGDEGEIWVCGEQCRGRLPRR
jgi:hypothetical protein